MRSHPARRKLFATTPTAFYPRPSWVPDEIECRVLLKLPHTNRTPTLATALRHTITAERQNRAVVKSTSSPEVRSLSSKRMVIRKIRSSCNCWRRGSLEEAGKSRKLSASCRASSMTPNASSRVGYAFPVVVPIPRNARKKDVRSALIWSAAGGKTREAANRKYSVKRTCEAGEDATIGGCIYFENTQGAGTFTWHWPYPTTFRSTLP